MAAITSVVIFLVVIKCHAFVVTSQKVDTLELAQVIFRHGDRNPLESLGPLYPNDVKNFPRGWGQLTEKGEAQTLALGQYFRQRYNGLIDPTYSPDQLFVVSSETDRSIMSALSVLLGLYPKNGNKIDMDCPPSGQLIPLKTIDPSVDNFLRHKAPCPEYEKLYNKKWPTSKQMQKIETQGAHLLDPMNEATGRNASSWFDALRVIGYMKVLQAQNRSLPLWVTKEMLELFENYRRTRLFLYTQENSDLIKKFRFSIIKKLIGIMMDFKRGKKTKKLYLYSAHDWTLLTIFSVLGFPTQNYPPYATSIFFELHRQHNLHDYYVEMYLRNETNGEGLEWKEPIKLEIPQCPSPCYLYRLEIVLAPILNQNYDQQCQQSTMTSSGSFNFSVKSFLFFMSGLLLMRQVLYN